MHAGAVAGACAFEHGVSDVLVMYDSEGAAAITGCQAAANVEPVLAEASAGLQVFFKSLRVNYTPFHVKGRNKNPWNELADVLAKHACKQRLVWCPQDFCFAGAVRSGRVAWCWLSVDSRVGEGGLPAVERLETASQDNVCPRVLDCDGGMQGVPEGLGKPDRTVGVDAQWKALIATYNVNSLKSGVVRSECDELFHKSGLVLVGLQETHAFRGSRTATCHYHCFESEDCNGNLGVQLWVHKSRGMAEVNGELIGFGASDALLVHSSCRLLAIVLSCGGQSFAVFGHAETEAQDACRKHSFWNELEGAIKKVPRRAFHL